MKRFSDFAKEALPFDGEKVAIEDLLNREINILAYKIKASKFNGSSEECLMLSVELDGAKRVLFTGYYVAKQAIAAAESLDAVQAVDLPGEPEIVDEVPLDDAG